LAALFGRLADRTVSDSAIDAVLMTTPARPSDHRLLPPPWSAAANRSTLNVPSENL